MNLYLFVFVFLNLWFTNSCSAQTTTKFDHAAWDQLLQKYVDKTGNVDYTGLQKNKSSLESYLKTLQQNVPTTSWSKSEQLAYWINVYNAFTIKLVIDNYPLKSIKDLHNGKPWDVKWIKIGDKTYSLNNIENDIIRPKYKEPRIHFAVNCAAKSCPPLLNKAWTANNLETNLANQAEKFINSTKYNQISASAVKASRIFDWYKEDFGDLINYLNQFSSTKINNTAKITFVEYDWALNKQ
jgi:hypothetical protein